MGQRRSSPSRPRPSAICQALESRTLLATVNIMDYGAVPNDSGDDRAAIVAAMNAAGAGGTVIIPLGEFRTSSTINISNINFQGSTTFHAVNWNAAPLVFVRDTSSTLKATGDHHIFTINNSNVSITGVTFDGRGIWMERSGGNIDNVTIDNNWFRLTGLTGTRSKSSIEFTTRIRNVLMTNNVFDPIQGEVGIYGYYWTNLTIANNAFLNGEEGIHVIDHSDQSQNLLVEQNYFAGLHRMAVEYQAGGWNTIVQDNWYEKPSMTSNYNNNVSTFAYSIVADRSHNTIVRRNVSIAPERPDGTGVRVIFEMGGFNMQVYDNYSFGGNHVVAVNGTGATGVVKDNQFSGYLKGPSNANGATVQFANNGANVNLTWSLTRGRPGPNHRLGDPLPPPPDPDPDPDPEPPPPDPNLPATPTTLMGTTVGLNRVDLAWIDVATTETGYVVELLSDDGVTWLVVGNLGGNASTFTMNGLASGKTYNFRVRAFNSFGFSAASNTATLKMPLPDTKTTLDPSISVSRKPQPVSIFRGTSTETILPPIIPGF